VIKETILNALLRGTTKLMIEEFEDCAFLCKSLIITIKSIFLKAKHVVSAVHHHNHVNNFADTSASKCNKAHQHHNVTRSSLDRIHTNIILTAFLLIRNAFAKASHASEQLHSGPGSAFGEHQAAER